MLDNPPRRRRVVWLAVLFEGGLGALAAGLGWLIDCPPWQVIYWKERDLLFAVGATLPLLKGVSEVNPTVIKTSAGATEHLLIAQETNLTKTIDFLKKQNIWIVGLAGEAKTIYHQANLTGALALVVGNEGKGISRLVREHCDLLIKLPMRGHIDSLNAAVAGSIALYEALRQREHNK